MTDTASISIAAFVSDGERAAVQIAATQLAQSLSKAADTPWTCDAVFSTDIEALQKNSEAKIVVTSFLPELAKIDEPWAEVEKRLQAAYATLSESGASVFICTVLRHVRRDLEPEKAEALMIRIRRLNLLAAEISRESGAFVIDLDRILADIGARRLQTDYQLAGTYAAEVAGHAIALTIADNALDVFVPFEVQDAAAGIIAANEPTLPAAGNAKHEVTLKKEVRATGEGRRKQVVMPVVFNDRQVYAKWYLEQVMKGKVSPLQLMQRLGQAVRQHGVIGSASLITTTLSKQLRKK
jgi:hypothetical protein